MKKAIFSFIIIGILITSFLIGVVYFINQKVKHNPNLQPTPTVSSTTCPTFGSYNVNGLYDVPELFPDLLWEEVNKDQSGDYWPGYGAASYIKLSEGEYNSVDILNGKAWSASYTYEDQDNYNKLWEKFNRYYSDELSKRGWAWKTYVHGFEVMGISAGGPTGVIDGYIKIQNGRLRVLVIDERGSYEGEFPYDAKLVATTFTIFLSDPVSLSEILPGYKPSAYLGVMYTIITSEIKEAKNLPFDYGALVISDVPHKSGVIANSSAEKAGIKDGYIILAVNGQRINKDTPLTNLLERYCPGDQVILHTFSNGTEKETSVVLGEY